MDKLNNVNATELKDMIRLAAETNLSLFIHGSFGLGKSQIVRQAAEALNATVVEERLSQVSSEDAGILMPAGDNVRRLVPDVVHRCRSVPATSRPLLFLDEFTSASPSVMAAFGYELLLDRALSGYALPEGTIVVAAGNLTTDRGLTNRMPSPAANRVIHVTFTGPTPEEWLTYAAQNNFHPLVMATIRNAPLWLTQKVDPSRLANPTPRSWEMVSRLLYGLPEGSSVNLRLKVIASAVGDEAALVMETLLRLSDKVPSVRVILADPQHAPVPEEAAALYFVVIQLASRLYYDNIDQVLTYIRRLPEEYQAVFTRTAVTGFGKMRVLVKDPAFYTAMNDYMMAST